MSGKTAHQGRHDAVPTRKEEKKSMAIKMEDRETSAILAGLRLLEALRDGRIKTADAEMDVTIDDIESNGGEHEVLEADEIDALCERINTSNLLIEG